MPNKDVQRERDIHRRQGELRRFTEMRGAEVVVDPSLLRNAYYDINYLWNQLGDLRAKEPHADR